MGWGPRGDSGSARSRVRATQPTQKRPACRQFQERQRIQAEVERRGIARALQKLASSVASVPGEARTQQVALILRKLRYDGGPARTEDRPV